jgi:hypothetical protein
MNKQRLRLIPIGLLLLLFIWLAWPEREPSDGSNNLTNTESGNNGKRIDGHILGFGQNDKHRQTQNRTKHGDDSAMNRIDRLIRHQTLSNREVAEQLRIIAKDKRIPVDVRTEAFGHGVILDLSVFSEMAGDTQLPEEMAEDLLQHVINENGNPALQIRAYLDFLSYQSPEIREEAKQLLAFILEDDLGEADEAALRQMAAAKLKQIEAEKPPEE